MKHALSAIFALAAGFAFAAADDALIVFSTSGAEPDRYGDGTAVLDGECYALVWSADGVFEGFLANGSPSDAADRVVLIAPVARGGHCPEVMFQVPAATAKELAGGKYGLFLLDTRVKKGDVVSPRGTPGGRLEMVNGYGAVSGTVQVADAGHASMPPSPLATGGLVASSSAPPAAGTAQPRVKHFEVVGDNVFLTVENMPGFMRVHAGDVPTSLATQGAATETDDSGGDVILVAPKRGSSGFYRVIRN